MLITADEPAGAGDDLRALRDWLIDDDEFRGRVETVQGAVRPGHLGPALEALSVVLTTTAAPLATLVVTWLRNRRNDLTITVQRPDGASITLEAQRFRNLAPDELAKLTAEARRQLEDLGADPGNGTDGRPGRT